MTSAEASPRPRSRGLHIVLWVVQVLLALFFLQAGLPKIFGPWVPENPVPMALFRFIGVAEVLGAIGLIVPAFARISPGLTPVAALGLLTIMVLAIIFHATRGEPFVLNVIVGLLALFVAWGRARAAPIPPR